MKLTNTHRDAFVRAVMQDVPFIDHQEEARSAIVKMAELRLPKDILAIWKDSSRKQFLLLQQEYIDKVGYIYYPGSERFKRTEEEALLIRNLGNLISEQNERRNEIMEKLNATIRGCSTRKKAAELLPEFEKYLPNEAAEATKGVPMITDLVSSLTKLGWPKNDEKPENLTAEVKSGMVAA